MIEIATANGTNTGLVESYNSISAVLDNYTSDDILSIDRYGNTITVWIK